MVTSRRRVVVGTGWVGVQRQREVDRDRMQCIVTTFRVYPSIRTQQCSLSFDVAHVGMAKAFLYSFIHSFIRESSGP